MPGVRMIALGSMADLPAWRDATAVAQALTGCAYAEDFISVETPDRLLHVELWESPARWDAAWQVRHAELAPLLTEVEFYRHARFAPTGPTWVAVDDGARGETLRWPAPRGSIRILILVTADPAMPAAPLIDNAFETRAEPGCGAYEYFRGLDHDENLALLETWASPAIYDAHWRQRLAQNAPPPPPGPPRRYGETSFEWYPECRYALEDECWRPADPARSMDTVLW